MDRTIDVSADFVLSAGTVTVDPKTTQMLLILHNKKQEYLFPKGRKDIGETLDSAAVRETFEETGYKCELKPHTLPTKATGHSSATKQFGHTEPIACQQRIIRSGRRKIIFWYYAEGDSTAVKELNTQDVGEDFTSLWVEAEKAVDLLTFEDDKRIAKQALLAMKGRTAAADTTS